MAKFNPIVLANVTNGTDATYYYYFQPGGYPLILVDGVIGAGSGSVTVTYEATFSAAANSTAAAALTDWKDVSTLTTGAASYTADFLKSSPLMAAFTWVRAKVVANTGGANDGDWKLVASLVDYYER